MLGAKIYSTLGNPNSLIPLAIKDTAGVAGLTAGSFVTGKEEGQDRFIDEVGTEIIWIAGIPTIKKFIDMTVFKLAKLDPKFDVRNLNDPELLKQTIDFAPNQKVKESIEKISKNQKLFKGLNIAKFVASVGLTTLAYFTLTNAKQKFTMKNIEKNLLEEQKRAFDYAQEIGENKAFSLGQKDKSSKRELNFKGGLQNFMLNPVQNMYVLEGSITGSRLAKSRNKQEFFGYAIKEGGFLFFMYYAGQKLQSMFEKFANNKHKKNIALDARVLEDVSFMDSFKSKSIEKSLKEFPVNGSNKEIYEFIHKNPENEIVKRAKQSDIVENFKSIFKKTDKIDTRKFIDIKQVKEVNNNISTLYEQYKTSGETAEQFFSKLKKLKRTSIIANMGISILAIGVIIPGLMLAKRLANGDVEFEVKNEIKQKLIDEGKLVGEKTQTKNSTSLDKNA